ncbi:nucleolar protein 14 [Chaetomium sp. MPI-SDFR-AT-0129]|nr:nucleolar protein 14 [Chaetomium sp. MPI-SDFR-AT-0129]
MAGSQLKRLKASLRDQGIIGPQQSKKQKRKNAEEQRARPDKRLQRGEALASIREQFNPFQFKTNARGPKFEVTTNKPVNEKTAMGIKGRPGVAKAAGEERRRQTILVEMQRRNKVGGLIDRRFGEDDPNMSLEDKMIERFTREQQRNHKKSAMFDLEEDDEAMGGLTHMGKPLFDDAELPPLKDDFDEEDLPSGDESDGSRAERRMLKRQRLTDAADGPEEEAEDGQPERKKTKNEIYQEIIAKSKQHKYERQALKDEDDELRAELDEALPELQALLFQRQKPPSNAAGATVATGQMKAALEKDYDIRVKQLAADKRAQPAERTKTEEEVAEEESNRLRELEEKRLRRMRGEAIEEDEEEGDDEEEAGKGKKKKKSKGAAAEEAYDPFNTEENDEFGLGKGVKYRPTATELGFDDEDDFLIDDDLVASGSELELESDADEDDSDDEAGSGSGLDDDDDEFVKGILTEAVTKDPIFRVSEGKGDDENGIPYTFPCPQDHEEMLQAFEGIEVPKLPVAVQRIRALYHPKLDSKNKERLGRFSQVLVQHVVYLGDRFEPHWFPALESLTRHIHSLAKSFPIEVAKAYRAHIQEIEQDRPLALSVGDLLVLAAVGTTFPTSDHFHQVVTPAMLAIARYLGQKIPQTLADYATGTYLAILALQYQQFSKRYVPELMNFCLNTLCALAPEAPSKLGGFFPIHEPAAGIRIKNAHKTTIRKLTCADCQPNPSSPPAASSSLKLAILNTTATLLKTAAETWHTLPSFPETFTPVLNILQHLTSPSSTPRLPPALLTTITDTLTPHLTRLLRLAHLTRRPLELHHHRPLAIRTYIPKFEDSFDPDKHYDPDRERAELAKLKAEHKRERKGAMRELRKDAAFMQRENLRVKKERDAAYEKKYKRLVAEIQGEEGKAANEYAREKEARKRKAARGR